LSKVDPFFPINFIMRSYRKLSVSSLVITGSGEPRAVRVEQDYSYSNEQSWIARGNDQVSLILSTRNTCDDDLFTYISFSFTLALNSRLTCQVKEIAFLPTMIRL
jgi:hypothetical protein